MKLSVQFLNRNQFNKILKQDSLIIRLIKKNFSYLVAMSVTQASKIQLA